MGRTSPTAAEQAEHRLGVVLRDRYRIERVLGAGGMATVYLAVHRNGNRVALKMLRPELSVLDVHRERFVREAYVANSIDHPGAVRVLDDDVAEDGCPFLVMELLQGETLEAYYRRSGRLPPREVLAIGHAVCEVLARAHARGVVHRDIKPDNIFLTAGGELKVLDFGIAQVRQEGRESGTRTGHMLGTPAYMPPEQALGRRQEIDGRSDLWALGATMFALLAGRAVHQSDTPEEMVVKSAMLPAPSLAALCPEVPAPITAVVERALAFASRDRFPDADAMRAAIEAAHVEAFGVPIAATSLPRGLGPTMTWAERSRDATFAAETLASDPGHAATGIDRGEARSLSGNAGVAEDEEDEDEPEQAAPEVAVGSPAPASASPTSAPPRRTSRSRWLGALAAVTLIGAASVAARALPRDEPIADEPAAQTGCTSNAGCAASEGRAAICRKDQGRCVALETDRCRLLADAGDVENDDTLWIGAMYSTSDASSSFGVEASRCIELARRDFAGLTGGLPPTRPGGRTRPIGVILCDDTGEYERSAAHLVDEVGVPAILGFGRSKEVLELANAHLVPKGVLALASNTAAMLSSIPHPPGEVRLVYRMTTSAGMTAPPKAAFVRAVIERELRAGVVGPEGTLRIAVVRSSNASGTSHTDALFTALAETRPGGPGREEVRTFVVEDSITGDPAVLVQPAAGVAAFAPHIVLDGGAPSGMLAQIERAWTTGPRPRYVHGGADTEVLRSIVAAQPDFAARFQSIGTRHNTTVDKVRAHYLAAYPDSEPSELSPTPYDAFYVLAYAAIAVGDAPLTGRSLARAVSRLGPPGEPIEVGPAGIYPALKVLAGGGNIDLRGTLTNLDFDPETGDASADFAVFCLAKDGSRLLETATHYDATTRTLAGDGRCP